MKFITFKYFTTAMIIMAVLSFSSFSQTANDHDSMIKAKVEKIANHRYPKAKVEKKDGTKVMGMVGGVKTDTFTIVPSKGASVEIAYSEVAKVSKESPFNSKVTALIGVGAGVLIVVAVLLAAKDN